MNDPIKETARQLVLWNLFVLPALYYDHIRKKTKKKSYWGWVAAAEVGAASLLYLRESRRV